MDIQSLTATLKKLDTLEAELSGINRQLAQGLDDPGISIDLESEIRNALIKTRDLILKKTVCGFLSVTSISSNTERKCLIPISHFVQTVMTNKPNGPVLMAVFVNPQLNRISLYRPNERKTDILHFDVSSIHLGHIHVRPFTDYQQATEWLNSFGSERIQTMETSRITLDWLS